MRKKLLALALLMTIFGMRTSFASPDWKEFYSEAQHFKVLLPTDPKHQAVNSPLPDGTTTTTDVYTSVNPDGTFYLIAANTFSKEMDVSDTTKILEACLKGMLVDNTVVVSSQFEEFHGHKTLDFLLKAGTTFQKGKITLVGHSLYDLLYDYDEKLYNQDEYDRFLQSFNVINR